MSNVPQTSINRSFDLWRLFGYVTVCAMLSAAAPFIGIMSAVSLMVMAFFLSLRLGVFALVSLFCASLSADIATVDPGDQSLFFGLRQAAIFAIAIGLCIWYFRRSPISKSVGLRRDDHHETTDRTQPSFVISKKSIAWIERKATS